MSEKPPFERFYDLADLGRAGAEIAIALTDAERKRLAEWAGIDEVEAFQGIVTLKKNSATRFVYAARFSAAIRQSCVVTLEPVRSEIEGEVTRDLYISSAVRHALPKDAGAPLPSIDDEVTEEIEGPNYDLAVPLLEEVSLAIDPYPRAPGVAFEPPDDMKEKPESPFAALKALKTPK